MSESFVKNLIRDYLLSTGRSTFSYYGLRMFFFAGVKAGRYASVSKGGYDWHTIERTIRRLAEKGILERVDVKRGVFRLSPVGQAVVGVV